MIGAILGDIIGSRHEFNNIKTKDFELLTPECQFTDDTVMTCAVAQAILNCNGDYEKYLHSEPHGTCFSEGQCKAGVWAKESPGFK